MKTHYEFRNADGTICCSGRYLCDKCKQRALTTATATVAPDFTPQDGYAAAIAAKRTK
jgi:hypothetical protein